MPELWRIARERAGEFDAGALDYHRYRPRYPEALFDDLAGQAGLSAGSRVVEIGAGTGLATGPLARRGYDVTAIEPAPEMAAVGREETGGAATWVVGRFEDWTPERPADLVLACNAWHWIEPQRGVDLVAEALRPGGALAIVWTPVVQWGAEPFEQRLAEAFGAPWTKTIEPVFASLGAVVADPRFGELRVSRHRFGRTLDAAEFVAVTRTYGGPHTEARDRILTGLIEEVGGTVTKVEEAVLHLARRLP